MCFGLNQQTRFESTKLTVIPTKLQATNRRSAGQQLEWSEKLVGKQNRAEFLVFAMPILRILFVVVLKK
jgi:hypothetical protein